MLESPRWVDQRKRIVPSVFPCPAALALQTVVLIPFWSINFFIFFLKIYIKSFLHSLIGSVLAFLSPHPLCTTSADGAVEGMDAIITSIGEFGRFQRMVYVASVSWHAVGIRLAQASLYMQPCKHITTPRSSCSIKVHKQVTCNHANINYCNIPLLLLYSIKNNLNALQLLMIYINLYKPLRYGGLTYCWVPLAIVTLSYVFISPEKVAWKCMSSDHPLCNNTDVQLDEGMRCNMTRGVDWVFVRV